MKHQLLDIEAELSCAYALLQAESLNVTQARKHVHSAQLALLALAELEEQTENAKPDKN